MTTTLSKTPLQHLLSIPVIVASLGYFVDIYDLLLFGIVRRSSLQDLGLDEEAISSVGKDILNWQMGGLLIGGILWGVLGDKKGRLSVLFGSIITYSIANIACGFIQDPTTYAILRFVAGVGLAGELGAGITLVSEVLPKELRALGSSLVAGVGLFGAVAAYFTVTQFGGWRNAYFIGGGLGIILLLMRISVFESGMFENAKKQKHVSKGNFFALFTNANRLKRYLKCIAIGMPTWFVIGILATFADEFGKKLGIPENIEPGKAIMFCYVGLAIGDLSSGVISQVLQSRKKAVTILLILSLICSIVFLYAGISTASGLYTLCVCMGFSVGYWAMFVTIGAEQFGTNLRATAATTVPNMVRGTVIGMTLLYANLKGGIGVFHAAAIVGIICFTLAFYSILTIPETHGKDLDYLEED
ncbi:MULTISPECIES: MFS transporter [unclassified Arcicella]|uniref:MFS transporter n=1 Tax=unclassified Arcicella TaxID=2644986 RepID=UPI00285E4195|nr:MULTISPECIES: MFS transporter [unclassified Arcicella]MDR6564565.1 MFS family permease [Arcicella sp. BE51]MDR6825725.1 MFS family permease [Arcicella sp. BE139]